MASFTSSQVRTNHHENTDLLCKIYIHIVCNIGELGKSLHTAMVSAQGAKHSKRVMFAEAGELCMHFPGPLVNPADFDGSFPIAVVALSGDHLCILSADASIYSLTISSKCLVRNRGLSSGHRVGRALAYNEASNLLVAIGDGKDPCIHGNALVPDLSASNPSIAAWNFQRGKPRRLFAARGSCISAQAHTQQSPACYGEHWRATLSLDGRFAAIWEPRGGWNVLGIPDRQSVALRAGIQCEDQEIVTSFQWLSGARALVVKGDSKVLEVDLDGSKERGVVARDVGVVVLKGACVAQLAGGSLDQQGPQAGLSVGKNGVAADSEGNYMMNAAVLEPVWEDGAKGPAVCINSMCLCCVFPEGWTYLPEFNFHRAFIISKVYVMPREAPCAGGPVFGNFARDGGP
jgi:hypothetical protein